MDACDSAAVAPRRFKAVLFDLDGTLLDTRELILASMRHAVQSVLGRTLSDEVLLAKVGQPLEVQYADFAESEEQTAQLCAVHRVHNAAVHDEMVRTFEGIPEALERLHRAGYCMGVVTSKRHELAQHGLDVTGIAPFIDFLVGPDDWPEHKPAPGCVAYGCRLAQVAPEECAYVGDSPFDMQAGRGAGCFTVAALWGMYARERLEAEAPDVLCVHPAEMAELFC